MIGTAGLEPGSLKIFDSNVHFDKIIDKINNSHDKKHHNASPTLYGQDYDNGQTHTCDNRQNDVRSTDNNKWKNDDACHVDWVHWDENSQSEWEANNKLQNAWTDKYDENNYIHIALRLNGNHQHGDNTYVDPEWDGSTNS